MSATSAPPSAALSTEPGPGLAAMLAHAEPGQRARLLEIRRDWLARIRPIDAAELAAAEAVVAVAWRAELLTALEARLLTGLARGVVEPGQPSLATLERCRARLDKDNRAAAADLAELRRFRPSPLPRPDFGPDRLEWLAAKLRAGRLEGSPGARHAAPEPAAGSPPAARLDRAGPPAHAAPEPAPAPLAAAAPG